MSMNDFLNEQMKKARQMANLLNGQQKSFEKMMEEQMQGLKGEDLKKMQDVMSKFKRGMNDVRSGKRTGDEVIKDLQSIKKS
jgi:hypothetical protein